MGIISTFIPFLNHTGVHDLTLSIPVIYCWITAKLSSLKNINILLLLSQIVFFCDIWPTCYFRKSGSRITWRLIHLHVWCLGRENLESLNWKELGLLGHLSVYVISPHVLFSMSTPGDPDFLHGISGSRKISP